MSTPPSELPSLLCVDRKQCPRGTKTAMCCSGWETRGSTLVTNSELKFRTAKTGCIFVRCFCVGHLGIQESRSGAGRDSCTVQDSRYREQRRSPRSLLGIVPGHPCESSWMRRPFPSPRCHRNHRSSQWPHHHSVGGACSQLHFPRRIRKALASRPCPGSSRKCMGHRKRA